MVVLIQLFKVDEIWSVDVKERTTRLAISTITASGDRQHLQRQPIVPACRKVPDLNLIIACSFPLTPQ